MKISAIGAIVAAATFQRIGSVSASPVPLNPQPLPPGRARLDERSPLNPQPLPPGLVDHLPPGLVDRLPPGLLNVLPPGLINKLPPDPCVVACLEGAASPTKRAPLNPQPLPPGIVDNPRFHVAATCINSCSTD